jgi:uncharacterized protein YndB with AHSA1/START domain
MLKKSLLVLAVALVALVVFVATRPDTFRVERSVFVAASPERLFGEVADFHRWDAWSPWAKLDPGMKTTFDGSPGAVGSKYAWTGNGKVGEGRMTVVELRPPRQVVIRLEFLKPFEATNQTVFDFADEQGGTRVAWIMTGPMTFVSKAMCLVKDMDAMIGPDFEKGLTALKGVAERAP